MPLSMCPARQVVFTPHRNTAQRMNNEDRIAKTDDGDDGKQTESKSVEDPCSRGRDHKK